MSPHFIIMYNAGLWHHMVCKIGLQLQWILWNYNGILPHPNGDITIDYDVSAIVMTSNSLLFCKWLWHLHKFYGITIDSVRVRYIRSRSTHPLRQYQHATSPLLPYLPEQLIFFNTDTFMALKLRRLIHTCCSTKGLYFASPTYSNQHIPGLYFYQE